MGEIGYLTAKLYDEVFFFIGADHETAWTDVFPETWEHALESSSSAAARAQVLGSDLSARLYPLNRTAPAYLDLCAADTAHLYRLRTSWQNNVIYVPVLYANKAAVNLWEFDDEEAHPQLAHRLPDDRAYAWLAMLWVNPLLFSTRCRTGRASVPRPFFWASRKGTNSLACLAATTCACVFSASGHGPSPRSLSTPTISHLVANAVFSCLFLRLFACRTGSTLAVFLIIWIGGLANAACALLRHGFVLSIFFSTALFAAA